MIIQENTIIHGDSLTVLRQMEPESVDAIITDPPYGINYVSQDGGVHQERQEPLHLVPPTTPSACSSPARLGTAA